jgi:hypothetical protein
MRSLMACKSSFRLCPPLPNRLSTLAEGVVLDEVPGFTNLPGAGLLNLLPELLLNGAAIRCSS